MLFLKFPDSINSDYNDGKYPEKLFKEFEKVFVIADETKTVSITLSYYNVSNKKFINPSGIFIVCIEKDAIDLGIYSQVNIV